MLELPPNSAAVVSSLCSVSSTASNSSMSLKPLAFLLSALLQNHSFGCFVKSQAADYREHANMRSVWLANHHHALQTSLYSSMEAHLKPRLFYITIALPRSNRAR